MLTVIHSHDQPCVSLQQVKAHLRLDHADDDNYLLHLIKAATNWVEDIIESPLLTTTFLWRTSFLGRQAYGLASAKGALVNCKLPKQNITDIKRVVLIDKGEQRRAIPYKLFDQWGQQIVQIDALGNCIEIEFNAGYGERPDCVPAVLRQAIINHVACHYDSRIGINRNDYLSLLQMVQPYQRMGIS